jgi:putative DNA primase/helicase
LESIREGILPVREFMTISLPERETFLDPWLRASTLSMIYGARGVGKTWFTLALCTAITRSLPLGPWEPVQPVNCLLVDGEMSLHDLQGRLRKLEKSLPESPSSLAILSSERQQALNHPLPRLTDRDFREGLTTFLRERPDLRIVVFDNLGSMSGGVDENAKQEWDEINSWLISLRFMGLAVILIHHSGKSGDQRGTSGREDNLDFVLRLSRPSGYQPQDGAVFEVEFTKSRGVAGAGIAPFQIAMMETEDSMTWTVESRRERTRDLIIALLGNGVSQKEAAALLQCSKGLISRIKKQAVQDGVLELDSQGQTLRFTARGSEQYGKVKIDGFLV